MIISNICAGLGNQLFQYAIGHNLAILNKTEHRIDTSGYTGINSDPMHGIRVCALDNFNITAKRVSKEDLTKFNFFTKNKIFRHLLRFYSRPSNYYKRKYILEPEENHFKFDSRVLTTKQKNDVYIDGYWQSEKYFKNIEDIIRREFSFKYEPDEINRQIINDIEKSSSISLHVRHGDNTKIIDGVLPLEYYYNAVEKIALKIKDPIFYIFSDDPEWARSHLKLKYSTVYISHNGDKKNYEDLRLMTYCKHHIIGNSTFSWWGAWLGKKEGQIVFSPKSNHSYKNLVSSDHIPQDWIFL